MLENHDQGGGRGAVNQGNIMKQFCKVAKCTKDTQCASFHAEFMISSFTMSREPWIRLSRHKLQPLSRGSTPSCSQLMAST